MKKKVICLLGPTASGKTETALYLADQLPIQIISVDSAMIYQQMDIGTAKPSKEILAQYPHALVDICSPMERYSVAQFRLDATRSIESAFSQGKIPLLVGGTFLYFHALLEGISPIPAVDEKTTIELNQLLEKKGSAYLHHQLIKADPESGQRINPNDSQRILRALGVYMSSGKTLTHYWSLPKKEGLAYPFIKLALFNHAVEHRNQQIKTRYQQMIKEGLVAEVKKLRQDYPDLNLDFPSMRAVGYRQIWEYLQGYHSLQDAIELAIIATRQYAKRQRTWLRREQNLISFDINEIGVREAVLNTTKAFLEAEEQ